jgi:hypothetical protein
MMRFRNMLPALAFVALTGTAFSAYAGPCTAQIAQVEQQISAASANSDIGPSSDAEMKANTLAQTTTLERAKEADAADHAAACTRALSALEDVYGLQ